MKTSSVKNCLPLILLTFRILPEEGHEGVLDDDHFADVIGLEQLRQDVGDLRQNLFVVATQQRKVLQKLELELLSACPFNLWHSTNHKKESF